MRWLAGRRRVKNFEIEHGVIMPGASMLCLILSLHVSTFKKYQ